MEMLPVMIGVSLLLGASALAGVVWCVRRKQFEDPDKAVSMALHDEEAEDLPPEIPSKSPSRKDG